jgi:hypothetical protein
MSKNDYEFVYSSEYSEFILITIKIQNKHKRVDDYQAVQASLMGSENS